MCKWVKSPGHLQVEHIKGRQTITFGGGVWSEREWQREKKNPDSGFKNNYIVILLKAQPNLYLFVCVCRSRTWVADCVWRSNTLCQGAPFAWRTVWKAVARWAGVTARWAPFSTLPPGTRQLSAMLHASSLLLQMYHQKARWTCLRQADGPLLGLLC